MHIPIDLNFVNLVADLLELLLLATILLTTTATAIGKIIVYYKWQIGLLFVITILQAGNDLKISTGLLIGVFVQIALWFLIRRALILATVGGPIRLLFLRTVGKRLRPLFRFFQLIFRIHYKSDSIALQQAKEQAERIWQDSDLLTRSRSRLLIVLAMVFGAFLIAFQVVSLDEQSLKISLAVSLSLYLVGLHTMISKRDLISQVIGLLIMDQGLYLAVVKLVERPELRQNFMIGLLLYTSLTIVNLFYLLPNLRENAGSLDLDVIAQTSDPLRG